MVTVIVTGLRKTDPNRTLKLHFTDINHCNQPRTVSSRMKLPKRWIISLCLRASQALAATHSQIRFKNLASWMS